MTIKEELKQLAKNFGLKLTFKKMDYASGFFNSRDGLICLDSRLTTKLMLSVFFHELGHCFDMSSGLYNSFYNRHKLRKDKFYWNKVARIAFNAEVHTDKTGKMLMKYFYPEYSYIKGYQNRKKDKEYVLNNI